MDTERYAFDADYFDASASLVRKYTLLYFPDDNTVELIDMKSRKVFLKRNKVADIRLRDLFVGAVINVFSRQMNIVGYADDFTRKKLGSRQEKTLALIKPDAVGRLGEIIDIIESSEFTICNLKLVFLSRQNAEEFYAEHRGKPFFESLVSFMTSGPIVALELLAVGAIQQWRTLLGPTNTSKAKQEAPSSIRAQFGTDNTRNACHGSDSAESAVRELQFFFGQHARVNVRPVQGDSTLVVIKPHAVQAGLTGKILTAIIEQGFEVAALQTFVLNRGNAEEFLEVYKGVVPEYAEILNEFTSGPLVAAQICHPSGDTQQAVRAFVGPSDPDIAQHIRPGTLRARFGQSKVKNAVHCTDLPDDTQLEIEFFFKLMQ